MLVWFYIAMRPSSRCEVLTKIVPPLIEWLLAKVNEYFGSSSSMLSLSLTRCANKRILVEAEEEAACITKKKELSLQFFGIYNKHKNRGQT